MPPAVAVIGGIAVAIGRLVPGILAIAFALILGYGYVRQRGQ